MALIITKLKINLIIPASFFPVKSLSVLNDDSLSIYEILFPIFILRER